MVIAEKVEISGDMLKLVWECRRCLSVFSWKSGCLFCLSSVRLLVEGIRIEGESRGIPLPWIRSEYEWWAVLEWNKRTDEIFISIIGEIDAIVADRRNIGFLQGTRISPCGEGVNWQLCYRRWGIGVSDTKGTVGQTTARWFPDENGYFVRLMGHTINRTKTNWFCWIKRSFCSVLWSRGCGKTATGAQKAIKKSSRVRMELSLNPDLRTFVSRPGWIQRVDTLG